MEKIRQYLKDHANLIATLKLILFLYVFFLSLQLMGDSLKAFGKDLSESLIGGTANPFIGLFVGILATSIIQSSSSTTSIVVGLVAGGLLSIETAIPIIMGANIGTSITNTIASLPQMNRTSEFRRAFAAATVHDFFNFLAVIILFPLQLATNFLGKASSIIAEVFAGVGGLNFLSPVKEITKPVSKLFLAEIQNFIPDQSIYPWIALIIALALLFLALKNMVTSLKVLVVSKAKTWFDRYLFKTDTRAFIVGIILTVMVQSSSITTSLIVPMAGAGILTLYQIFPYTLGSNIGTTVTALLAALVTGSFDALVIAISHLLFNISGIIIWWPLKFVPITLAEKFSDYATRNKLMPIAYVLFLFFILPLVIIYFSN